MKDDSSCCGETLFKCVCHNKVCRLLIVRVKGHPNTSIYTSCHSNTETHALALLAASPECTGESLSEPNDRQKGVTQEVQTILLSKMKAFPPGLEHLIYLRYTNTAALQKKKNKK